MKKPPPAANRFKPGEPRPAASGRRKGTRNMLCESFIADLVDEWREHGSEIIRIVRAEEPAVLMKIIAQLCPKELEIKPNALAELTDEQLDLIASLLRTRSAGDDTASNRGGTEPTLN